MTRIDWFLRRLEVQDSGCWVLAGGKDKDGYPMFSRGGRGHRYSYTYFKGMISEGLQLDHLCRNRGCVNPDHLEAVTCRENLMRSPIAPAAVNARRTHCNHGHEFTEENTAPKSSGGRRCRACSRISALRSYHNRKIGKKRADVLMEAYGG